MLVMQEIGDYINGSETFRWLINIVVHQFQTKKQHWSF